MRLIPVTPREQTEGLLFARVGVPPPGRGTKFAIQTPERFQGSIIHRHWMEPLGPFVQYFYVFAINYYRMYILSVYLKWAIPAPFRMNVE